MFIKDEALHKKAEEYLKEPLAEKRILQFTVQSLGGISYLYAEFYLMCKVTSIVEFESIAIDTAS